MLGQQVFEAVVFKIYISSDSVRAAVVQEVVVIR